MILSKKDCRLIEESRMRNLELRDLKADVGVGFQVDNRNRVWVCIDGQCVLRVVGAKHVEITDLRTNKESSGD